MGDGNWNKADAAWRKSSTSLDHGNCVELAPADDGFAIRDSKNAAGPVLAPANTTAFLATVKASRFDLPS